MLRTLVGLSLALAGAAPGAAAQSVAAAQAPLTITYAEQNVQLVRDTSLYSASRGVLLQPNDMLQTAGSAIQLDVGGTIVAVGPASRIYIKSAAELILLDGWMKVAGSGQRQLSVRSANVQLAELGATVTLHAAGGSTELFGESADLIVNELPAGKKPRRVPLPREQFAVRDGGKPLKIVARPPAAFLAAMPRVFKDTLVPLKVSGAPVVPKRERAATLAELAHWLGGHALLGKQLQQRFSPPRPVRPAPSRLPTEQY